VLAALYGPLLLSAVSEKAYALALDLNVNFNAKNGKEVVDCNRLTGCVFIGPDLQVIYSNQP